MSTGEKRCPNCQYLFQASEIVGLGAIDCPNCQSSFFPSIADEEWGDPEPLPLAKSSIESPSETSAPRKRRPATTTKKKRKKKPKPPPTFFEKYDPRLLIGGGIGLLVSVGLGIWLFSDKPENGPPNELVEASELDSSVDWFGGDYLVFDDSKAFTESETKYPSFESLQEANGKLADENEQRWRPFAEQSVELPESDMPEVLPSLPIAANAEQYVLVQPHRMSEAPTLESDRGFITSDGWCQRYDRTSRKPVGLPIYLGSRRERLHPAKNENTPVDLLPAALSDDGELFVARAYGEPGRVRIQSRDGTVRKQFAPGDAEARVHWVGWGQQGLLLIHVGETLVAWSIDDDRRAWEVKSGSRSFAILSPAGDWLALAAQPGIDLLETATGNRIAHLPSVGNVSLNDAVISPDGLRLAAIYAPLPHIENDGFKSGKLQDGQVIVWDLQTGQAFRHPTKVQTISTELAELNPTRVRRLDWEGRTNLLIHDEMPRKEEAKRSISDPLSALYDASFDGLTSENSSLLATFKTSWTTEFDRDGLGQPWLGARGTRFGESSCYRVTFLNPKIQEHKKLFVSLGDRDEPELIPIPKLRLEIDAGSEKATKIRAQQLKLFLNKQGVELAPGGFTLRVLLGTADHSGLTGGNWGGIRVPKVVGSYKLFSPEGKEVFNTTVDEIWKFESSRYYLEPDEAKAQGLKTKDISQPGTVTQYWDFSGGTPWNLMVEEICEGPGNLRGILNIAALLRGGGEFQVSNELKPVLEDLEQRVWKAELDAETLPLNPQEEADLLNSLNAAVETQNLEKPQQNALKQIAANFKNPKKIRSLLSVLKQIDLPLKPEEIAVLELATPREEQYRTQPHQLSPLDISSLGVVTRLRLPEGAPAPAYLEFSRDGKTLQVLIEGWLYEYELATGEWTTASKFFDRFYKEPILALSPEYDRAVLYGGQSLYLVSKQEPDKTIALEGEFEAGRLRMKPVFTSDGKQLLGVGRKGELLHWDANTGKLESSQELEELTDSTRTISVSSDGSLLAASRHSVDLFHYPSLEFAGSISHKFTGRFIGDRVMYGTKTSSSDVIFYRVDADEQSQLSIKGPFEFTSLQSGGFKTFTSSHDGASICQLKFSPFRGSSPIRMSVALFELESGATLRLLDFPCHFTEAAIEERDKSNYSHTFLSNWIAMSPEGDCLAVNDGQTIHLVDLATPKDELLAVSPSEAKLPDELAEHIAPQGLDPDAPLYARQKGFVRELKLRIPEREEKIALRPAQRVYPAESSDFVWVDTGGMLFQFDRTTGEMKREIVPHLSRQGSTTRDRIFDPSRVQLAMVDFDNQILLVTEDKPDEPTLLEIPRNTRITPVLLGFAADGSKLFLETVTEDRTVELAAWDIDKLRISKKTRIESHLSWNYKSSVDDGGTIAVIHGSSMRFLDTRNLKATDQIRTGSASCFSIAENLKLMVLGQSNSLRLFSHKQGVDRLKSAPEAESIDLKGDRIAQIGLSNDGKLLASLQYDPIREYGWLSLWDTDNRNLLGTVPGLPLQPPSAGTASQISFTSDDQLLFVPLGMSVLIYDVSKLLER